MKLTAAKIGKIKIAVTATILSLVVIAAVIIACESFGVFPGDYCNRIAVNSYMKKAHEGVEYTVLSQSFEEDNSKDYGTISKNKYYVFECRIDNTEDKGKTFDICAYGMKVVSDGYYKDYVRSKPVEEKVNIIVEDEIKAGYVEAYPDANTEIFDIECNAILPKDEYGVSVDDESAKKIADALDNNFEITVYLSGDKIEYDSYKKLAAQLVEVIHGKLEYDPAFIQLLYYRDIADGEVTDETDVVKDNMILSYESSIEHYELAFDMESATGMHFYVELSEKEYKKLKAYNIFQYVYVIFIAVVVVALTTLWTVRKFKKWNKAGKSNSNAANDDISAVL